MGQGMATRARLKESGLFFFEVVVAVMAGNRKRGIFASGCYSDNNCYVFAQSQGKPVLIQILWSL
jgi:hypothetical protein